MRSASSQRFAGCKIAERLRTSPSRRERLAATGVRELILVAQDLTAYGVDLPGRPTLHDLVARLAQIDGLAWIRLMYAYCATSKSLCSS